MLHWDHSYQKINNNIKDNEEEVVVVMSMCNLLEYSDNYYRHEVIDDANENDSANNRIKNNKTLTSKSFEYKTKLIGSTLNNNNILDAEAAVSLKYFRNVWRYIGLLSIDFEVEVYLSWLTCSLTKGFQKQVLVNI